jgi:branched-chain amino acid transport system permease protein
MSRISPGRALGATVLLLAALLLPPFLGSGWQIALTSIFYVMFLCVAWNIIAGFAGQFALGQPVFLAVGAYTSSKLLMSGVTPWLGMLVGALLSGVLATGVGLLAFRYRVRGLYFALLTFALLLVVENLVAQIEWLGGTVGLLLPLGDSTIDFTWRSRLPYYYVMLGLLAVAVLTSWRVATSRLGWRLNAVQQDEDAAPAIGIDVNRAKLLAFVISAMLTSLAGTFYAQYYQLISPETMLSFEPQIQMLLGTIIGGIGTLAGPLVGGLLVGGFNQLLLSLPLGSQVASSLGQVAFALFLVLMSLRAPHGLVGLYRDVREKGVRVRVGRFRKPSVEEL